MASAPRSSRPRLFDAELREKEPTSPLFLAVYALTVVTVWWIITRPEYLPLTVGATFGMVATLLWAPPITWVNPIAWERRWEASGFARRQSRFEARTRQLLGLTARYSASFSAGTVSLFVLGLFLDMPAPVVFLVVGGLLVTLFLTLPVCLVAGFVSGALIPTSWRDDEPPRVAVALGRLMSPDVQAHAACAALGAALVGFALTMVAIGT